MAGTLATENVSSVLNTEAFVQPTPETRIYKDECIFCYKTPLWKDGLYINLNSYLSFCRTHAEAYANKTGHNIFVQYLSKKVAHEGSNSRAGGEPNNKMSKLAIEDDPKFDFEETYNFVIYPDFDTVCEINEKVDERLTKALDSITTATSAERLAQLNATSSAWDAEIKLITKHANLQQHDNGTRIPNSGWKCGNEDCDLTENLWLCLTDGQIRCGRSQFISEGKKSVGNGHMQQYYEKTGYPLVVKLGTICAQLDAADVYSYDENDAVIDPNLDKHLAHFGLEASKMQKTAKSTMEMELDMNEKWEWSRCQEDGVALEPVYGPGYTGLVNTGSSCYMNSVLQAILEIDSFRKRFIEHSGEILSNLPEKEISTDFNAQFAKLLTSMMSGDYSQPEETATSNGIKPLQFKRVAAGNHAEFSTAKQQDVEEYIRFLLERVTEKTPEGVEDPTNSVRFRTWNRFEDLASKKVRYTEQEEVLLHLTIPQNILTPVEGNENRLKVEMTQALSAFFEPQIVEGYKSPITGEVKGASNTIRFKTFPDYLFVQVQKFAYSMDGQMKKLDLDFEVNETLDLSAYRGNGKLDDEECLPEDAPAAVEFKLPENVRNAADQLKMMGFHENACTKAAFEANGNVEIATEWLMNHLDDATINDPFVPPNSNKSAKPAAQSDVDPSLVSTVVELGFTPHQAKYALRLKSDVAQAIDWLFNNIDSVPAESAQEEPTKKGESSGSKQRIYSDGNANYKLIGMISHMGSKPDSGHYVAHILKDGKWVLFNDEKVALSQDPPLKLAYVYLYKRVDA